MGSFDSGGLWTRIGFVSRPSKAMAQSPAAPFRCEIHYKDLNTHPRIPDLPTCIQQTCKFSASQLFRSVHFACLPSRDNAQASRSSSLLCTGSSDNTARLWDALRGECHHVLQGHRDQVPDHAAASTDRLSSTLSHLPNHPRLAHLLVIVPWHRCAAPWKHAQDLRCSPRLSRAPLNHLPPLYT